MICKIKGGFKASFLSRKNIGFTLIELVIVIAIIGVLSALALPAYQTYFKKSSYTEIVLAAESIKVAVDTCFQTRGNSILSLCDQEEELGISLTNIISNPNISSASITPNSAVIILTSSTELNGSTYILSPTPSQGTLVWNQGGTCIAQGLC